ncbi:MULTISPECIES: capsular biosynthesis protein [Enterococcus]|uniref:capsular biosynthesis protein n=2 Tax=Enterococcus TaxID=1350 RepID=UPI000CF1F43F|nr:glycosyltransferase family 4 protein [Enterococcus faecium]PQF43943.1 capsular biosynthesis protein [Enterococcus faecium]ROX47692.1 capsular biosynthesis protein [Enterococcus faecium]
MRIAIVSIVNIKHMTLISLYTDIFKKNGVEYDLIFIDKYQVDEKNDAKNVFKYNINISKTDNKINKIMKYAGFRKYAKKIIQDNNYDFLIIWKSETSYLLFDFLEKYYKNRYILNIRDYARDDQFPISIIQKRVIKNSNFTTISSPKFLNFLPQEDKYLFVNSINPTFMKELEVKRSIKQIKPIRICFIGYVRFIDNDKKFLMALKNDDRFIVQYFGSGANELKEFAEINNIYNTEFIDSFDSTDTIKMLKNADIINNLYGNANVALDTAISIKYYYSLLLKIPILVWKDTYMQELTNNMGNAFVFDGNYDNLGNRLALWYRGLDWNNMNNRLTRGIKNIKEENKIFQKKIFTTLIEEK